MEETLIINDITTQTSIVKMEVVDETCDESVTEQNQHIKHENSGSDCVSLKTEPDDYDWCCKSSLYEDHYVKDELVIGPTVLQNQNGVLENPLETEDSSDQSHGSESSLTEQRLSLKELSNVENKNTSKECNHNKSVSADIPSLQPERIATDTGKNRLRLYKCDVAGCQKAYYHNWNLKNHKRTHSGEKPSICTWEGCGLRFLNSGKLSRHTRKHTGERPFACALCQLQFTRSDNLSKHMKSKGHVKNTTDTGETRRRPYKCCQKVYYNHKQLTAHKRTHSGSKPYICNWEGCGWRFGSQEELARHTRSKHTGPRPFSCALCQLRFARLDTLSKHMRTKKHKLKENEN